MERVGTAHRNGRTPFSNTQTNRLLAVNLLCRNPKFSRPVTKLQPNQRSLICGHSEHENRSKRKTNSESQQRRSSRSAPLPALSTFLLFSTRSGFHQILIKFSVKAVVLPATVIRDCSDRDRSPGWSRPAGRVRRDSSGLSSLGSWMTRAPATTQSAPASCAPNSTREDQIGCGGRARTDQARVARREIAACRNGDDLLAGEARVASQGHDPVRSLALEHPTGFFSAGRPELG